MAEAEIKTVRRVYLANKDINRRSGFHTAYVGDGNNPTALHRLVFVKGVASSVPMNVFARFQEFGVVTTERPRAPQSDWVDEE